VYGDLEQLADGRWQLRFTRHLRHAPEKVWRAITEPEHLAFWFPTEMLTFEEGTALEFTWGGDVLRLELREVPEGTELTLLDTLDERGKAARDGTGWHTCLDALEAGLLGRKNAREELSSWREVNHEYVKRFGPQAATIGPPEGFEETE
jgi:uncharacterized protein YndB with AHSA1/START domain